MEISIYRINYGMILFVFMLLFFFLNQKAKLELMMGISTVKREARAGLNVQIYFGWLVGI